MIEIEGPKTTGAILLLLLIWMDDKLTQYYLLTFYPNPCPSNLLSKVMSYVSWNCAISCITVSILYFFCLALHLWNHHTQPLSPPRWCIWHLFSTYPNHQILFSASCTPLPLPPCLGYRYFNSFSLSMRTHSSQHSWFCNF